MPDPVRHPIFARLYALMSRREPAELLAERTRLLAGLHGRVLELGAGAGSNFAHYPATVAEVVAVEPEPYMREQARAAAARAPVAVTVVDGVADALPLAGGSVDGAVACLVLCSVPDQARALGELHRVLRPGGELRFLEHVRSHTAPIAATQELVDRTFWPHAFGGCHTPAAIAAAGFELREQDRFWLGPKLVVPARTHARGVAVKPA